MAKYYGIIDDQLYITTVEHLHKILHIDERVTKISSLPSSTFTKPELHHIAIKTYEIVFGPDKMRMCAFSRTHEYNYLSIHAYEIFSVSDPNILKYIGSVNVSDSCHASLVEIYISV
jgi:hypothetical protein